jgi:hypothetical protein
MEKQIEWIDLNHNDSMIFLSKFSDTDKIFTTIYSSDISFESALNLKNIGFKRIGHYFFREGNLFNSSELKNSFPNLKPLKTSKSSICFLYSDNAPDFLKLKSSENNFILSEDKKHNSNNNEEFQYGDFKKLNNFQVEYKPLSKGGVPIAAIPVNLAEGTFKALSKIQEKYGDIDNWVCKELKYENVKDMSDVLSPEQIDAVALSIYNALEGNGTICADQTGLGKGRVGAALARWSAINERLFIFLTEKANLFTDFWRDIVDTKSEEFIGKPYIMNNKVKIIDPVSGEEIFRSYKDAENKKIIDTGVIPQDTKMVMTTYSQLSRKGSNKSEFFKSICKNAHIHADECHNAAGTDSNTSLSVAQAMEDAQSYSFSSATHARHASNMSIYSPILPPSISKSDNMLEVLESGGSPLLESLSQMLAKTGRLVRREHDLSDMKINLIIDKERKNKHEEYSDRLAPILSGIARLSMEIDNKLEEKNTMGRGEKWYSVHWGTRLPSLVNQFTAACKIDVCVEQSVDALMNGEKPVIVLVNTMETLLKEIQNGTNNIENEMDLFSNDNPTFRDVLKIILDRSLDIRVRRGKDDPEVMKIDDKEILQQANKIKKLIDVFPDLPISPIDEIQRRIEEEGNKLFKENKIEKPWKMSEISARNLKINRENKIESIKEVDRNEVINGFQNGQIDGLVLTKAASTGLSLHANTKSHDKRPRVMFEFQIPPNVVERVQFWGRIKRRGGVNEPRFACLSTDLPFELRGLAVQNKKVSELSANVTGSSQAAVSMAIADPINSLGNKIAQRLFQENRKIAFKMGVSLNVDQEKADSEMYFVNRILSRLALLNSAEREAIFNSFMNNYLGSLKDMESRGQHPTKPKQLYGEWQIEDSEIFEYGNAEDGEIFGSPVYLTTISQMIDLRPIQEKDLKEKVFEERRNLEDKFGSSKIKDAFENIVDYLKENQPEILKSVLPQKYSSVMAALTSNENNMVQIESEKIKNIRGAINSLNIGSNIKLTVDNEVQEGVVLKVDFPEKSENYTKLGQYFVYYILPGDEEYRKASLATLYSDKSFEIKQMKKTFGYDEWSDPSFNNFKNLPIGETKVERKILDGNSFMAAKFSSENQIGTSTIINIKDVGEITATLIPKSKQNMIKMFPGITRDKDVIFEIVKEGGVVSTKSGLKYGSLALTRDGPDVVVVIPGKKKIAKPFLQNDIKEITGEFTGDWRGMKARMSPEDVMYKLIPHLLENGFSFKYESQWRGFVSDYLKNRSDEELNNSCKMN